MPGRVQDGAQERHRLRLEGEQVKLEELRRLMSQVLARWICCRAGLNDRIAIEAVVDRAFCAAAAA